jgi:isopenicillin N synthase-like dioxygenase
MLAEWTGGLYVSTLHRVRHNSDKMRISIPLFFDPNMDALISPVLPLDRKSRPGDGVLYREAFVKAMKEYGAY